MGTTKVENGELDLVLNSTMPLSAFSAAFINIELQLQRLNAITKMAEYHILREGETDEWNVTAITQDARQYATTITFVDDQPYYTETTLQAALPEETRTFLNLIDLIIPLLKVYQVSSFDVKWEPE
jgi:hypothetical protein